MNHSNVCFQKSCKSEILDNNDKLRSRFRDAVSHKINFTANGLHRDHSQAWGFMTESVQS